jgi:type I restriction-modification system DNA methylase subunit
MPAPQIVLTLVENFERNLDAYRNGQYKETQVRRDFIDPFFKALGWDMDNRAGYAEAYRDVIHEDVIKVGVSTRAPDYSFRVGGQRKFFLEAKKPSVNVKDDVEPAFQLRRYAWSAKLPLSIVTDFEEFAVYDCRQKPNKSDKASQSRLLYCTFREYAERWDEITKIFSKDAVLKGSFDKYAGGTTGKRGTTEVDSAFLEEIENWRNLLAHNIALRNANLSQRQLNFAVQQTIDRVIFLRICEDRGIEFYGRLRALQNGDNVYGRLRELFREADDRYNSGLFHFSKERHRAGAADEFTLHLSIDDKPLKEIFKNLYYPDSPYEFSVLGADILGSVYEQFLGKVIRLTATNRAVVEDKPDVKKAGGVFYTPAYIVQYIVKQTVGKLLDGKTVKQAESIRILDPACGSGSFLIGAYQYLLEWYLARYVAESTGMHRKGNAARIRPAAHGEFRLTGVEKKRILLTHIYGVDVDTQAVEVTKLSLLLKVLEDESGESLDSQMKLFHDRVLPDLDRNIQCGNSLIGPDFDDGELKLNDEAKERINPFDWQAGFPQVFKAGGFDAVIGNPPWGSDIDKYLKYFHAIYPATTQEHTDSFKLFIERSISLLTTGGCNALIVPSTILRQSRLKDVRALLLKNEILSLVDLGENVFKGVVAPSCIFVVRRAKAAPSHKVSVFNLSALPDSQKAELLASVGQADISVKQTEFLGNPDLAFVVGRKAYQAPVALLGEFDDLECKDAGINYQRVGTGMQDKGKSNLAERLLYEGKRQKSGDKMYWKGSDINRYWITEKTERFCRPNYRDFIRANEVVRLNDAVYETTPKIMLRQTADRLIATIDYQGVWFGRSVIAILLKPHSNYDAKYFLGILNSRYFEYLYNNLTQEAGRVFAQVKLAKLKQLPIRVIDFSNDSDQTAYNQMVSLVSKMIALHQQLTATKTPHDTSLLQRQIAATDKQIDELVYRLYNLTDEEIALAEKHRESNI